MKVKIFDTQGKTKDITINKEQTEKLKELLNIDYNFKKVVIK